MIDLAMFKDSKRILELWTGKSLSIQSLMGCCENLKDKNAESSARIEALLMKFQREVLGVP